MLKRGDIVYFREECEIPYLNADATTYTRKFEVGVPFLIVNEHGTILIKDLKDGQIYPLYQYSRKTYSLTYSLNNGLIKSWSDLLCDISEWREIQLKKLSYD